MALLYNDIDGACLYVYGGTAKDCIGGNGQAVETSGELWKFKIAQGEWGAPPLSASPDPAYYAPGIASDANSPGNRYGHAMAVDSDGNMILFGGITQDSQGQENLLSDLWLFNPTSVKWSWIGGTKVLNAPIRNRHQSSGVTNDEALNFPPFSIGGRTFLALAVTSVDQIVVYGGETSLSATQARSDVWVMTYYKCATGTMITATSKGKCVVPLQTQSTKQDISATRTWEPSMSSNLLLPSTVGHSITRVGNALYRFGGCEQLEESMNCKCSVYKYDLDSSVWSPFWGTVSDFNDRPTVLEDGVSGLRGPGARRGHCAFPSVDGSSLFIFGGHGFISTQNGIYYSNDVWKFDLDSKTWQLHVGIENGLPTTQNSNLPPRRANASCAVDGRGNFYVSEKKEFYHYGLENKY